MGIIAASLIPETFKEPFPECLEDVERRPIHPFFSFRVWEKKEKEEKADEKTADPMEKESFV